MRKLKQPHKLDKVDAPDLVLWKCSILNDDYLEQKLNDIRFDVTDTTLLFLFPTSEIFKHFAIDSPGETINILVQLPDYGGCGTHITSSMLNALIESDDDPPPSKRARKVGELPPSHALYKL